MSKLKTVEEALSEALQNKEEIVSLRQAADIIVEEMRKKGFKATKMSNYGLYSFTVTDMTFAQKINSLFATDKRITVTEKIPYNEYIFKVKELGDDIGLSLTYEVGKSKSSKSRLVLATYFED